MVSTSTSLDVNAMTANASAAGNTTAFFLTTNCSSLATSSSMRPQALRGRMVQTWLCGSTAMEQTPLRPRPPPPLPTPICSVKRFPSLLVGTVLAFHTGTAFAASQLISQPSKYASLHSTHPFRPCIAPLSARGASIPGIRAERGRP